MPGISQQRQRPAGCCHPAPPHRAKWALTIAKEPSASSAIRQVCRNSLPRSHHGVPDAAPSSDTAGAAFSCAEEARHAVERFWCDQQRYTLRSAQRQSRRDCTKLSTKGSVHAGALAPLLGPAARTRRVRAARGNGRLAVLLPKTLRSCGFRTYFEYIQNTIFEICVCVDSLRHRHRLSCPESAVSGEAVSVSTTTSSLKSEIDFDIYA